MLLYYPFWMFMGFTLHIYIIFGTNLLTGGPARIAVFFAYFSVSKKRNIKRSPKRNETFMSMIFGMNVIQRTWSGSQATTKAATRVEGAPPNWARPPCLVGPSGVHRRTSSSYISLHTSKKSREQPKKYFRHRNLLYPRDPILEHY